MTKLDAGTKVRSGHYFCLGSWKLVTMTRDGEPLPDEGGGSYVCLPVVAVLLLAPVMGGAFVLFLPFIGFYLVTATAARRAARALSGSAAEMAAVVHPGWAPGEAHLTGRRPEAEEKGRTGSPTDDELCELARAIEEKRRKDR